MPPQRTWRSSPRSLPALRWRRRSRGRTPDELTNEATKRFLALRQLQDLQQYGRQRAAELGLVESDVPRLIAESRAERQR